MEEMRRQIQEILQRLDALERRSAPRRREGMEEGERPLLRLSQPPAIRVSPRLRASPPQEFVPPPSRPCYVFQSVFDD
jgi:hypothetical protein